MSQRTGKRGLTFFGGPEDSPELMESGAMSMPTMDPEPPQEQVVTWALSGGQQVRVLFQQEGNGMSLVWSRFEPGFPLPRHSHSADCVYYVLKGEARMGSRTIPAGAGFFVPEDAPYAYTAGPEGIEILEFRGVSTFDMRITESLERWAKIAEISAERSAEWQAAPRV